MPHEFELEKTFVDRLCIGQQSPETDDTDTKSLYEANGPEKNHFDEERDCWENRKGRWVRVHGIARRTLSDPMHDEQPFCQGLTERRRSKQNEVTIDDTWPQAGEMRKLWQGVPNFGQMTCHRTPPVDPTDITAAKSVLPQSRDSKRSAMFLSPRSPYHLG